MQQILRDSCSGYPRRLPDAVDPEALTTSRHGTSSTITATSSIDAQPAAANRIDAPPLPPAPELIRRRGSPGRRPAPPPAVDQSVQRNKPACLQPQPSPPPPSNLSTLAAFQHCLGCSAGIDPCGGTLANPRPVDNRPHGPEHFTRCATDRHRCQMNINRRTSKPENRLPSSPTECKRTGNSHTFEGVTTGGDLAEHV